MENKIIYTSTVLLGSLAILMLIGVATSKGETADNTPPTDSLSFVEKFCFEGKVNEMDVSDLVDMYTEKTNDYFNEKIREIMTDPLKEIYSPSLEKYAELGGGLCRNNGIESNDMTCQAIAVCTPVNTGIDPGSHPYCLAMTLLGVPPTKFANYNYEALKKIDQLQYSYLCYRAALNLKRDSIFDSTPQSILAKCGTDFGKPEICDLKKQVDAETDPAKKSSLQNDLDYELNKLQWWRAASRSALSNMTMTVMDAGDSAASRIKFIDEEIVRAKIALDQTLDAYGQLRTAWQMHVEYMDVFAELVKYRDHLVDIRKQTDTFPFRFIDATSTKCS